VEVQTARNWWAPDVLDDVSDRGRRSDCWGMKYTFQVEKATKKRRGGRRSNITPLPPWLDRAVELLNTMDGGKPVPKYSSPAPALSMRLRERKPEGVTSGGSTPREVSPDKWKPPSTAKTEVKEETIAKQEDQTTSVKKLPRVILKVGPPPSK